MFENKFVSLPSHLKTIEPMEVHRGQELCVIQKLQKVISSARACSLCHAKNRPHDSKKVWRNMGKWHPQRLDGHGRIESNHSFATKHNLKQI